MDRALWCSPFLPHPHPTSQLNVYTPGWRICHFLQIFAKSFPEQEASLLQSIPWESWSSGFHGNALALISVCVGTEAKAGVQTDLCWAGMRRRDGWIALTLPSLVLALRDNARGMFGMQSAQMPVECLTLLPEALKLLTLPNTPPLPLGSASQTPLHMPLLCCPKPLVLVPTSSRSSLNYGFWVLPHLPLSWSSGCFPHPILILPSLPV